MSENDEQLTELIKGHVTLANQVAALTRLLLGFVGEDNKLYPGIASRIASLETKMDVAMRVLGRVGTWSLRLLAFISLVLLLEFLNVRPHENVFGPLLRVVFGG